MFTSTRKYCWLASFCILFVFNVHAQKALTSENDLKKQADRFFNEEKYEEAAPMYSQLLSLYPKETLYSYRYGVCLMVSGKEKSDAIPYLEPASKNADMPVEVWHYLGKGYMLNAKYAQAIDAFGMFKQKAPSAKQKKLETELLISNCEHAIELSKSRKSISILHSTTTDLSNFYSLYDFSDASGRLVPTAEQFLTSIDKSKQPNSLMFITRDGQTVYFSSFGKSADRGKDIYCAKKLANGHWSDAKNLGEVINSNESEDFPYLASDGKTMYFSSRGHNSIGGYDIFKSTYDLITGKWSDPINMGIPINTVEDDLFFMPLLPGEKGMYATTFGMAQGKAEVKTIDLGYSKVKLLSISGRYISVDQPLRRDARVSVLRRSDGAVVSTMRTDPSTGQYELLLPPGEEYTLVVEGGGYIPHAQNFDLPESGDGFRQVVKLNRSRETEAVTMANYFTPKTTKDGNPGADQPSQELTTEYNINQTDSTRMIPVTIQDQVVYTTAPKQEQPSLNVSKAVTDLAQAVKNEPETQSASATENTTGNASNDETQNLAENNETISGENPDAISQNQTEPGKVNGDELKVDDIKIDVDNKQLVKIAFEDAHTLQTESDSLRQEANRLRQRTNLRDSLAQVLTAESSQLLPSEKERADKMNTQAKELRDEIPSLIQQSDQMNLLADQRAEEAKLSLREAQTLLVASGSQSSKKNSGTTAKPETKTSNGTVDANAQNTKVVINSPDQSLISSTEDRPNKNSEQTSKKTTSESDDATQKSSTTNIDANAPETTSPVEQDENGAVSVTSTAFALPEIKEEARQAYSNYEVRKNQSKSLEFVIQKIQVKIASMHVGSERDSLTNVYNQLNEESTRKWKEAQASLAEAKEIDPDVEKKMEVIHEADRNAQVAVNNAKSQQKINKPDASITQVKNTSSPETITTKTNQPDSNNESTAKVEKTPQDNQVSVSKNVTGSPVENQPAAGLSPDQKENVVNDSQNNGVDAKLAVQNSNENNNNSVATQKIVVGSSSDKSTEANVTGVVKNPGATSQSDVAMTNPEKPKVITENNSGSDTQKVVVAETEDKQTPEGGNGTSKEIEAATTKALTAFSQDKSAVESGVKTNDESKDDVATVTPVTTTSDSSVATNVANDAQSSVTEPTATNEPVYKNNPQYIKLQKKINDGQAETVKLFSGAVSMNKLAVEEKEKQLALMNQAKETTDPAAKEKLNKEAEQHRKLSAEKEEAAKKQFAAALKSASGVKSSTAELEKFKTSPGASIHEEPVVVNKKPVSTDQSANDRKFRDVQLKPDDLAEMSTEIFSLGTKSPYSPEHPIPMNPSLPDGLVFKVQIGAFHKPIPDDKLKNVQPISAETTRPGWVRYCVGMFQTFEPANLVKRSMQKSGFKDAFVVVYYNGKRISLYEASAMLRKNSPASDLAYTTKAEREIALLKHNDISNVKYKPVAGDQDEIAFYGKSVAGNVPNENESEINSVASAGKTGDQSGKDHSVPSVTSHHAFPGIEYTVQVGVYRSPKAPAILEPLPSVSVDMMKQGMYRFTSGQYDSFDLAQAAKQEAVSKGIKDAFVIAWRDGNPISLAEAKKTQVLQNNENETNANNETTAVTEKAGIERPKPDEHMVSEVVFKVQIGAFKQSIPFDQVDAFLAISDKGITHEADSRGFHIFYAGNFPDYESALRLKDEVISKGVKDAFIAVFENGKRISIDQAFKLLRR